jgi:hypothetical protein
MMMPREDIHLYLKDYADEKNISVKQICMQTGYHKTTLYDFFSGEKQSLPICLAVLTALFEITKDVDLLLTGKIAVKSKTVLEVIEDD